MNLSLNLLDIHSIKWPFVTFIPNVYLKRRKIEYFLTMEPCHPKHSKSLSIHDIRLEFLQLICNSEANANWFPTCIPFSRFSREAYRNMKESFAKACATSYPQDGRSIPTMSTIVASLDNIASNGWLTIANKNGLSGHPWWTNLVRTLFDVAPWALSITRGICGPKPQGLINMIISFL